MEQFILDGVTVNLNKNEIISIGTNDNKTWRVVCSSGFQFDTQDQTLINKLLS